MKRRPEADGTAPDTEPLEAAKGLALRRLGRLAQTQSQLTTYLLGKGLEADLVQAVVDRMVEIGLVNDEEYAGMWIRSRRRTRQSGASAIRRELLAKGVTADLIEQSLLAEPCDEFELALELGTRKWRSVQSLPEPKRSERLVSHLVRRGHSVGTAWKVARQLGVDDV